MVYFERLLHERIGYDEMPKKDFKHLVEIDNQFNPGQYYVYRLLKVLEESGLHRDDTVDDGIVDRPFMPETSVTLAHNRKKANDGG